MTRPLLLLAHAQAHSDRRIRRADKEHAVVLRPLHPRIAVTPSHPDTATRVAGVSGGDVGPLPPVATVGSPHHWPWLLVPLGAGVLLLGETTHHATPSDSVPGVVPPVTETPEPAPLAYELAAVAVGAAWVARRRKV